MASTLKNFPETADLGDPQLLGVTFGPWWVAGAVVCSVLATVGVGALLTARQLSGAIHADLPRLELLLTALLACSVVVCGRLAWRRMFPIPNSRAAWVLENLLGFAGSLGLVLVAVGSCYPAEQNSDWLIWLPVMIADQFWRQAFFDNGLPGQLLNGAILAGDVHARLSLQSDDDDEASTGAVAGWSSLGSWDVLQQLFRVRTDDGEEAVYGAVCAEFQAGQRNATLHVGFCPPLARLPTVVVEPNGSLDVKVKVVQALAHGVRLDVRLPRAAHEPTTVEMDLSAIPVALPSEP